jgi:hypothetical protein
MSFFPLSIDCLDGARFGAPSASRANVRENAIGKEGAADVGRALAVKDMGLIFLSEITQRGQDRIGGGLSQPAEGGLFYFLG